MHYDCIEFKGFYESTRRLRELEEARGQLIGILEAEGSAVAVFEWGEIALPLELREKLAPSVGRTVAVLRLGGRFYVRGVDNA
mgnify:CR=1 FL=1|jgi:hypothetical protein